MIPIALTKIQDALEKLSPYMDLRTPIDEMTLRRIKNDVVKNMAVDPYLGSVALGNIALLEWNEAEVSAQYANVLRLRNNCESRAYFAMALQVLGKFEEASYYAREASKLAPTDLGLFREAILYTFNSGQFAVAASLCEDYKMRSPAQPYPDEEAIFSACKAMSKAGLDEALLVKCNSIAFELLRERRTAYASTTVESDLQDGCIIYFIKLDESVEKVDELDRELGERLFDRIPEFDPSKYWVGYAVESFQ
ncbi:hypothetical protein [Janthinobacterium tructae]|uniref:Tetratricopeptide repeat protein n=1 Tax=Janthinobacterium tructae TaxID=2590869 RepID=A0A4Y6RKH8_9BURK|nr:hypothetical protein [Janthinobacterium tructae]QDG73538.1 hypothetical protein FJQ89_26250 [Janthinobacterium tructae]